jgi:hypothetical protein
MFIALAIVRSYHKPSHANLANYGAPLRGRKPSGVKFSASFDTPKMV